MLLDNMIESLHDLSRCRLDADLKAAVKDLYNFIHNIRHLPWRCQSLEDQLSTMFPIRNWLRFVPRAPTKLAAGGDFLLYLYLANYETTMLAMGSILPSVEPPLAIQERYTCVARIREFVRSSLDEGFLQSEKVVNDGQAYRAWMTWLSISETCMQSHQNLYSVF